MNLDYIAIFVCSVTNVLGYLPQDLIGQISYEYFHRDDMSKMVHLHHEGNHKASWYYLLLILPTH